LFQNHLSLSANIGRQRDNLNDQKPKQTNRWIGAVNANVKVSERLMISGGYSNFTMFTNKQMNQFTHINDNPLNIQQPLDSIDYKQISQNINVNVNCIISSKEELSQSLNFNYSLNDMVNKENGIVRKGGISRFHNANISYTFGLPERKFNAALALSYTNTYASLQSTSIWGPALTLNKSYFEDKLKTTVGISYNSSVGKTARINTTNLRLGAAHTAWKKHNFSAGIIQMFRSTNQKNQNLDLNEMTATLEYNCKF
jgi:hypothetical protein